MVHDALAVVPKRARIIIIIIYGISVIAVKPGLALCPGAVLKSNRTVITTNCTSSHLIYSPPINTSKFIPTHGHAHSWSGSFLALLAARSGLLLFIYVQRTYSECWMLVVLQLCQMYIVPAHIFMFRRNGVSHLALFALRAVNAHHFRSSLKQASK